MAIMVMLGGTTSVDMPAGLIDQHGGVAPGATVLAILGEVQVHRLGVAGGQDQGCAFLLRADRTDVGSGALTGRARAGASLRPPACDLVLLTDARFVRNNFCLRLRFFRRFVDVGTFKILDHALGL